MDSKSVSETNELVSVEELKCLMSAVLEENAGIRFRFLIGGKWSQTFLRVLLVTEKGGILNDEYTNKVLTIKSLTFIEGFELEKKFDSLEKNHKYLIEQK